MTRRLDRAAVTAVTVMPATRAKRALTRVLDDTATGQRLERMVERVHALGPRVLAELIAEIATATGEPGLIADRIQAYAGLDPAVLRAVGADRFPPSVLGLVR